MRAFSFEEARGARPARADALSHRLLPLASGSFRYDLDEAMHRRITLAVEFRKPDHLLRERIWRALRPPKLGLASDVDLAELALKFELTGGFIKSAALFSAPFRRRPTANAER